MRIPRDEPTELLLQGPPHLAGTSPVGPLAASSLAAIFRSSDRASAQAVFPVDQIVSGAAQLALIH